MVPIPAPDVPPDPPGPVEELALPPPAPPPADITVVEPFLTIVSEPLLPLLVAGVDAPEPPPPIVTVKEDVTL